MVSRHGRREVIQLKEMNKSNYRKIIGLKNNETLELLLRFFLGITFTYSSFHKIYEPAMFAKIIYGYSLLPNELINIIAIILPFAELFSGIFLISGIFPKSGALLINIMLFAFIVAISFNLIRGHEFDCGCFSLKNSSHKSSSIQLLIRDFLYFGVGIYIIRFNAKRKFCLYDKKN